MDARSGILTALDLCDVGRCNAGAWVRVTLSTGELDLCVHHWREKRAALEPIASAVLDESHLVLVGA